jgi:hypothetical protein
VERLDLKTLKRVGDNAHHLRPYSTGNATRLPSNPAAKMR